MATNGKLYLEDGTEALRYAQKAGWNFAKQTGLSHLKDDFISVAAVAVVDALNRVDDTQNPKGFVATYVFGRLRNYLREEFKVAMNETPRLDEEVGFTPEIHSGVEGLSNDAQYLLSLLTEQPEPVLSLVVCVTPKGLWIAVKRFVIGKGWGVDRFKAAEMELKAVVS